MLFNNDTYNTFQKVKREMKVLKGKRYIVLNIFILFFFLAACGGEKPTTGDENNNNISQETSSNTGVNTIEDTQIEAENPAETPQLAIDRGDTVVVGLQEPGGVFTPYFNTSGYDGNIQSVMFPPLVEINEKGEPIPG